MKVVIIGAGVAGLGIGWHLAKAGASVTVLERAQVGNGATTASAGMIAATAELGRAHTPEAAFAERANQLWPTFAQELQSQSGIDIGYRKSGALLVRMKGMPDDGHQALSGAAQALGAAEARALEPMLSEDIAEAMLAPEEAQVDSLALCRALAVSFVRAGGKVLSNETAVRFEWNAGRIVGVVTPFAMHQADVFVLATGAWSSRIEGLPAEAVPPVTPIKGEIAVLSPPQGTSVPAHIVWGNGIYLTPRRGRLLVGATVERAGFDTSLTQPAIRWLYRQATGLMPGLASWRLTEHWAGLRPGSPDGLPILGETAVERLYVATGQYRNGILFAPAVSEALSRLILERAAVDPAFDPRRFEGKEPATESVVETPHCDVADGTGTWQTGF